jgi:hypothetical protein
MLTNSFTSALNEWRDIMWNDPHKTLNKARESASFAIVEADLDEEARDDGGLYAYVEADNSGVVIASRLTRWVFYNWPTMELYIESVHELLERGITNAAKLNETKFEATLARVSNLVEKASGSNFTKS